MTTLISNSIDSVMAIGLPSGIRADGKYIEAPGTALVKWRSAWNDKLYQVYVNGCYAGTTKDSMQRQMIVPVPSSFEAPVRMEVYAIEPGEAYTDFSDELDKSCAGSGRVKITLLRSQDLPIDAIAQIYFDNGTGEIDYSTPLSDSPIRIWPAWQDKAGFAMSRFGLGDFGYDSAAAVGFGKGSFGYGQFGLDVDTIEWTSSQLPPGDYKFAVIVFDKHGKQSSSTQTESITVTPAAKPAEKLSIESFDKQTNQLILSIS